MVPEIADLEAETPGLLPGDEHEHVGRVVQVGVPDALRRPPAEVGLVGRRHVAVADDEGVREEQAAEERDRAGVDAVADVDEALQLVGVVGAFGVPHEPRAEGGVAGGQLGCGDGPGDAEGHRVAEVGGRQVLEPVDDQRLPCGGGGGGGGGDESGADAHGQHHLGLGRVREAPGGHHPLPHVAHCDLVRGEGAARRGRGAGGRRRDRLVLEVAHRIGGEVAHFGLQLVVGRGHASARPGAAKQRVIGRQVGVVLGGVRAQQVVGVVGRHHLGRVPGRHERPGVQKVPDAGGVHDLVEARQTDGEAPARESGHLPVMAQSMSILRVSRKLQELRNTGTLHGRTRF